MLPMPERLTCGGCALHPLCLPSGLDQVALEQLDSIITRPPPTPRGKHLFRAGDPFRALLAIHTGSVKTGVLSEEGDESVTGFYLPGDLVGLDAIHAGRHASHALALESTSTCEIPFGHLEDLIATTPTLGRRLMRIMSHSMGAEAELLTQLARNTAEQRLAAFLCSLALRLRERGFPDREFVLTLSRHDMGSYLGLALETVSRLFSRFQQQGLIALRGKRVAIKQLDTLQERAGLSRASGWITGADQSPRAARIRS